MQHLAQLNIALPREPLTSPLLADFVAALDPINALGDAAPGFVWRLQDDDGDATAVRGFGDARLIINLTVWESIEALTDFVFRSAHTDVMRQRRTWFVPMTEASTVLWWVPVGHLPTIEEAEAKLSFLRTHGPTAEAFSLRDLAAPAGQRSDAPRTSPGAAPSTPHAGRH